jgi:hypothetical protein
MIRKELLRHRRFWCHEAASSGRATA